MNEMSEDFAFGKVLKRSRDNMWLVLSYFILFVSNMSIACMD